jgi:tetratricopeptide (TPR) repeat protein
LIDPIDMLEAPMGLDFENLPMDDFEGGLDLSQDDDYSNDRVAIADLMQGLDPVVFPGVESQAGSTPVANSPVDDLLSLGQTLQASGDLTAAIDAYGQALKLDGQNAVVYDALGTALQQYGNLPDALSAYRMATELDPNLHSAQQHLANLRQGIPLEPSGTAANTIAQTAVFGSGAKPADSGAWKKPASLAIAGLAVLGLAFGAANLNGKSKLPISTAGQTSEQTSGEATPNSETQGNRANLINLATQALAQQNPRSAEEAITALLDQGAIVEANKALDAVTPKQMTIPGISYLRGRTSWQLFQQGNQDYSPIDARKAWVMATQTDPNNLIYQNALGWAYYTEKDYPRATDAWTQILTLTKAEKSRETSAAHAGLSLSYLQLSKTDRKNDKKLRAEAIKLRDRVLKDHPQDFTDEALARNWLWTEKMIGDWKEVRSL